MAESYVCVHFLTCHILSRTRSFPVVSLICDFRCPSAHAVPSPLSCILQWNFVLFVTKLLPSLLPARTCILQWNVVLFVTKLLPSLLPARTCILQWNVVLFVTKLLPSLLPAPTPSLKDFLVLSSRLQFAVFGGRPTTPTASLTFVICLCFRASRDEKRRNSQHGQGYSTMPHLLTSEFSSGLESVRRKRHKQAATHNQ
jgi:hypothetical protein